MKQISIALIVLICLALVIISEIDRRTPINEVIIHCCNVEVITDMARKLPPLVKAIVTATIYNAVPEQTDSTPFETADGTIINPATIELDRIVALSRNLLARWGGPFRYGDKIEVRGAGKMDGIWNVHDTMNARFTYRIDFLVPDHIKLGKWYDVSIKVVYRR